jgi:hypothetical protein
MTHELCGAVVLNGGENAVSVPILCGLLRATRGGRRPGAGRIPVGRGRSRGLSADHLAQDLGHLEDAEVAEDEKRHEEHGGVIPSSCLTGG